MEIQISGSVGNNLVSVWQSQSGNQSVGNPDLVINQSVGNPDLVINRLEIPIW